MEEDKFSNFIILYGEAINHFLMKITAPHCKDFHEHYDLMCNILCNALGNFVFLAVKPGSPINAYTETAEDQITGLRKWFDHAIGIKKEEL